MLSLLSPAFCNGVFHGFQQKFAARRCAGNGVKYKIVIKPPTQMALSKM